jgi:Ser/Thr protein kinase RdoA (MazF antagonist)
MRDDARSSIALNQLASKALARWDADAASVEAVAQSENFVYRFRDTAGRERYLRISPPDYRPRAEIEAEIDFVRHLHARRVPVAPPVCSLRGKWVETFRSPGGEQYAVVFEAVYGEPPRWGTDEENQRMLIGRGKALGRMHAAARHYRPSGKFSRFHWYEDDLFTDPQRYLPKKDRVARREYEELIRWLLSRPATRENYGIVHGDFGSGNTLRQKDGSLVAFDFDDCLHHWYIYDLAVSIRSARSMPYRTRKRYLQFMLDGYAQEKDLGSDTAAEVGRFCRLAALYRYIAVLRDYDRTRFSAEQRRLFDRRLEVLSNPPKWH